MARGGAGGRVGWLPALAAIGALPVVAGAQQTGTITGRVTDAASGAPIPSAQLQIVGTNAGAITNEAGRYTIRGVPARTVTVRVLRVGYSELTRQVAVTAGGTATLDLTIQQASVNLTPVVTTATGETRRVELGNAISTIDAAKVAEQAPVANLSDLLNSRAAGVTVLSGTQTGTGARVRIRGFGSLSLNNDPIYVIDGVRMTSNNGSGFDTGGNTASRVGDLNPEEIENIEVVKGPSAATLYGTDAANGVIVITTKKGRAGATRWTAYGEGGTMWDQNNYPLNYTIAGRSPGSTALRTCTLPQVSAGTCLQDSVRTYSPFHDPDATPLGRGNRQQFGLQVSGGTEAVRFFASGEREDETGLLRLPEFERRRFDSTGTPIREWTDRPNVMGKNSVRLNLNAALNPKLDVALSTGFINIAQRYSLESNATAGLGSHAFGGPGFKDNGTVPGVGTPLNGYRQWTPGFTWQEKTGQRVNRFIGALNAQWRPTAWLQNRVNVGNDFTGRVDDRLLYRGEGPPLTAIYRDGIRTNGRTNIQNFTVDLGSTATWQPRQWLNSKTTAGAQYIYYQFDQNSAIARNLPGGAQTAGAGAEQEATEATVPNRTFGLFIEQAVALGDRLFLTAAVRTDQNSAFGTEFQNVLYPKASVSWLASEEGFFPKLGWLDQFRVRAAYGESGVQPGPNDALRFFEVGRTNVRATDIGGLIYTSIGNPNLKPEQTSEIEGGFEAKLFGNRLGLDLTYYYKRTRDAIIDAIVPPSAGAAIEQRTNLGAVMNTGFEALVTAQLVDRPRFGLDLTLNGSTNKNELLSLGGTPPQIGTTRHVREGYPLVGLWAQRIQGFQDRNNDGIITYNVNPALNEIFVDSAFSFAGYNQPRHQLAATTGIDLFRRRLRIQTLFDYRGGNLYYNNTERIRCASRQNCEGLMSPDASLARQATVVAHRDHPTRTLWGFFEKGDFVRLRELSVNFSAPERLAARLRARSLNVTLTGRNLGVWTDYTGVDPETDFTATSGNDTPSDFQTIGPPSLFVFRVNLGF